MTRASRPPLRLRDVLVWRSGSPIWYRFAVSVVVSTAVPLFLLASLGHLELALYTMAGSMQALFGHDRPFASRARMLAGLTGGQLVAVAASLALSAAEPSVAVLIAAGALTVTAQKLLCDAGRVGAPAQAVLSFITLGIMFGPATRVADIPRDLLLYLGAAGFAWLVSMSPWLVDRHGPEATAVRAAERAVSAGDDRRVIAALGSAWDALALTRRPQREVRDLVRRLRTAEDAFATGRGNPTATPSDDELDRELIVRRAQQRRRPMRYALRWSSPLWSSAALCLVGTLVAGLAAAALGIDRPYWAIVAAGAVYRGNTSVVWERALLRSAGTVVGVFVYVLIAPLAHVNDFWLVGLTVLAGFGIESFVSRNYAAGNVFVAPMALLMANFAGPVASGSLAWSRAADTVIGALLGLAAALVITNHRSVNQVAVLLDAARTKTEGVWTALDLGLAAPDLIRARNDLGHALTALSEAAAEAAGEWRVPTASAEDVTRTLTDGYRALVATLARNSGTTP